MFVSDAKARLHSVFDTLWVGSYNAVMEGAVFLALVILIPYICVLIWSESLFRQLERCGDRIWHFLAPPDTEPGGHAKCDPATRNRAEPREESQKSGLHRPSNRTW